MSNRVGEITQRAHDAIMEVPGDVTFPDGLRVVARASTATAGGVANADRGAAHGAG